jgi:hypothetical protein
LSVPGHFQLFLRPLGSSFYGGGNYSDAGGWLQGSLIRHQSIVYGLGLEARSRLNAVLFVVVFIIDMATGAALGATLLAWLGWPGVMALATASALAALAVRILGAR